MIEYYEAANEIDISENRNITNRGWQACINMVKRSHALQILVTRGTPLSESNAVSLGKSLLTSSLNTLKLEHCGLSGRPITSLCKRFFFYLSFSLSLSIQFLLLFCGTEFGRKVCTAKQQRANVRTCTCQTPLFWWQTTAELPINGFRLFPLHFQVHIWGKIPYWRNFG